MLAMLYLKKHEKKRESIHVDVDGTVHVNKSVDAEPIMDAVKAYGDFIDRHTQKDRAQRMVGSLDPITAYNWMKETGLKVGTQEFAKFAINRLKNDSDYRRFRVGG